MTAAAPHGSFYFDLASPACYLVAERILGELPVLAEWEPVHGAALGIEIPPVNEDQLAAAVDAQGLQPLRLPRCWPPDSELAMRAATYARSGGRTVPFSLAAFRQAFAGGRDLGDEGTVLIAAAACEMHPKAVLKGVETRSVASSLAAAGERARATGVCALPAIRVGEWLVQGPDALEQALGRLAGAGVT